VIVPRLYSPLTHHAETSVGQIVNASCEAPSFRFDLLNAVLEVLQKTDDLDRIRSLFRLVETRGGERCKRSWME
jgi:hypothetical protein